MAEKYTAEQLQAINDRGGSILVGAAAGSGKTTVLSERIVSMLADREHPLDASRILVLTFSKAAAAEMRQRIKKKLNQRIAADPGDPYLKRQQRQLRRARISTVHSFCAQLMREYFSTLNIPPDFTISEDGFGESMRNRAMEKAMEQCYSEMPDRMKDLVANFGRSRSDREAEEAVQRLYDFEQTIAWPKRWEANVLAWSDPKADIKETGWGKYAWELALQRLGEAEKIAEGNLLQGGELFPDNEKLHDILYDDLDKVRRLKSAVYGWNLDACAAIYSEGWMRINFGRGVEDALKAPINSGRDHVKGPVSEVMEKSLFGKSREEIRTQQERQRGYIETLFEAKDRFVSALEELKEERRYFEYNDLETYTLRLLYKQEGVLSEEASSVGSCYDQIFVDEFQDTNERQRAIFDALSHNGENLFYVGDVKQSIYSFRRADPGIFMNVRDEYEETADEYPKYIALQHNFRSSAQVIDSVNRIFDSIMSRQFGGVDYKKGDRLVKGDTPDRPQVEDPIGTELTLIVGDKTAEPRFIAAKILEMLREKYPVEEDGVLRPCRPEDFCVLLRSAKNNYERFRDELLKAGIPCRSPGNESFFDSSEIRTVLALLHAVDNPRRDVDIASVMLSPIGGFTLDDMVRLRLQDRKKKLWQILLGQTDEKSVRFVSFIRDLRKKATRLSVEEMVGAAITDSQAELLLTAPPDSARRKERLLALIDFASSYVNYGGKDLRDFLRYCENAAENEKGPSTGEGNSSGVMVTTIHKAKGLEWPFVFTANTEKKFNLKDASAFGSLYDSACGAGMKLRMESEEGIYMEMSPSFQAASEKKKRESKAEEMRVLYVALTRAKQKNFISATVSEDDADKAVSAVEAAKNKLIFGEVFSGAVSEAIAPLSWLLTSYCAEGFGEDITEGDREERGSLSFAVISDIPVSENADEDHVTPFSESIQREIDRRIAYEYPYQYATQLPTKITVTQMTHGGGRNTTFLSRPSFAKAGRLSATEQGTAVHRFMEVCNFEAAAEDPVKEIARLREGQFLDEREAGSIKPEAIAAFFGSTLGQSALHAGKVLREYQFLDSIPASEFAEAPGDASQEEILLQGVADCILLEQDHAVLIDFKTDRVKDPSVLKERYGMQIFLYRRSLEKMLNVPITECYLWSFYLGTEVAVNAV